MTTGAFYLGPSSDFKVLYATLKFLFQNGKLPTWSIFILTTQKFRKIIVIRNKNAHFHNWKILMAKLKWFCSMNHWVEPFTLKQILRLVSEQIIHRSVPKIINKMHSCNLPQIESFSKWLLFCAEYKFCLCLRIY